MPGKFGLNSMEKKMKKFTDTDKWPRDVIQKFIATLYFWSRKTNDMYKLMLCINVGSTLKVKRKAGGGGGQNQQNISASANVYLAMSTF